MEPATYKLLADLVVAIHFAFVCFVVLGGLLVVRWRWIAVAHLPAVTWVVFAMSTNRICPLTPLENDLRLQAGQAAYAGGFVDHYIVPVLYPEGLTDEAQWLIAVGIFCLSVTCYSLAVLRWRRSRQRHQALLAESTTAVAESSDNQEEAPAMAAPR
jgi:hypothetical protein